VSVIDSVRRHLPVKYRELAKFLVVGGTTYVVDVGLFTLMSHTVLANKVVTAKAISVIIATILSYILNREWSFSRRGGREPRHEAMLFFVVNGIALGLNLVPLALSQYVFGFNASNYASFTVSVANFISANIIGTILGMAFRFWAYRKWVFPEELTPHPELVALAAEALANNETLAEAEADERAAVERAERPKSAQPRAATPFTTGEPRPDGEPKLPTNRRAG
jgi:putative flippase GtrA